MVILTVHQNVNPLTVTFSEPLYGAKHMRLVSTITHNTPRTIGDETIRGTAAGRLTLIQGYYTAEQMTTALTRRSFSDLSFTVSKPDPDTQMSYKVEFKKGSMSHKLQKLLWLPSNTAPATSVFNTLNTPDSYFIHCDMVDDRQCLLNGKKTPLLGHIPLTAGDKNMEVHLASEKHPWRQVVERNSWYHVKFSIRDDDGELVDFSPNYITLVVEIV